MKNLLYVCLLAPGLIATGQTLPAARPSVNLQSVRPVDRIHARIDDGRTVALGRNRHPLALPQYDKGPVSPDLRMDRMILGVAPDPFQQASLDALLQSQQDPGSPLFRHWLTPQEFGASFGISDGDLGQVVQWLHGYGFQTEPVTAGRRSIVFSGTAAQVQSAFHTQIHTYEVNGRRHYANASNPEIPEALAAVVAGVGPLHDFAPSPQSHKLGIAPDFTAPDGATHVLAPADLASIYNVNPLYVHGIDGRGQSIAIVARTNIDIANVRTFRRAFGLPSNDPIVTVNGDDPGIVSDDEAGEAYLDVEWAGALAPNANIQFVVTAGGIGVVLSADYVVQNNLAPLMSMSFGVCEQSSDTLNKHMSALWQQAAAQGISVIVSSGDSGAAGCDPAGADQATSDPGVNALCSSPYSTCVGGTQFNEGASPSQYWASKSDPSSHGSALGYIPEVAWNESGTAGGEGLWASGGGVSKVYPAPDFQTKYFGSVAGRVVPDVALTAAGHDGYLVCEKDGSFQVVAGTSAAAPSFAGIAALLAQHQGNRVGNLNSQIYLLGVVQYYGGPAIFHDVTAGDNNVPGITGYYQARPWYDPVTGWGSVDATALVANWGQWRLQ
jgi:subtilase family serine protease